MKPGVVIFIGVMLILFVLASGIAYYYLSKESPPYCPADATKLIPQKLAGETLDIKCPVETHVGSLKGTCNHEGVWNITEHCLRKCDTTGWVLPTGKTYAVTGDLVDKACANGAGRVIGTCQATGQVTETQNNCTTDLFLPDSGTIDTAFTTKQASFTGKSLMNISGGVVELLKHYETIPVQAASTTKWNYDAETGFLSGVKTGLEKEGRLYLGTGPGGYSVMTGTNMDPLYWMSDETKWDLLGNGNGVFYIKNRGTKHCLMKVNGNLTIGTCDSLPRSLWQAV